MLAFADEHTYAEVASMLGVALGTIKARVGDGLTRLRPCMQASVATREQEAAASQLHIALDGRLQVELARGILAERLHLTPDESLGLLRRYARIHNRHVAQLADGIARGTATIRPAAAPQGSR